MRIRWLGSAEDDVDRIADYLDPLNPVAAHRTITKIEQAVEKLRLYPFVGRHGRGAGTRELVVLRTPYIVVNSVQPEYTLPSCTSFTVLSNGLRKNDIDAFRLTVRQTLGALNRTSTWII